MLRPFFKVLTCLLRPPALTVNVYPIAQLLCGPIGCAGCPQVSGAGWVRCSRAPETWPWPTRSCGSSVLEHGNDDDTITGLTAVRNDLLPFKARAYTSRINSQRYAMCHTETDHCWLNHRKRTMAADIPNIKKTNQAFMNREIIYY